MSQAMQRSGGLIGLSARQSEILQAARTQGRVGVDLLALRHRVTPQTIRRDLNDLCARGLLARVHGGALPANSVSNLAYEDRRGVADKGKRRIGAAAAALIPDNSSIMLNLGTTTEQVARAIYNRRDLIVVTNNINVVNILSGSPQKDSSSPAGSCGSRMAASSATRPSPSSASSRSTAR